MATQRVDLLREYLLLLEGERAAWEARAQALQTRDPVQSRASYDRLTTSLTGVRAWMEYLTQQLSAIGSRIRDEEAMQRNAEAPDSDAGAGVCSRSSARASPTSGGRSTAGSRSSGCSPGSAPISRTAATSRSPSG